MKNESLQKAVDATKRNKASVAKYDARRPVASTKPEVNVVDLNPSLLQQGLKRMKTSINASNTKQIDANREKRAGIVASRKQVSGPTGPGKSSVKKVTEKSLSLKR